MSAMDPFTLQDNLWFEAIAEYSLLITIDDANCVRWKHSDQLVEDYMLDELYREGYISANARATTIGQLERQHKDRW